MKVNWNFEPGYDMGDEDYVSKMLIEAMRDPNCSIVVGVAKNVPLADEDARTFDFHSFMGHNEQAEPFALVMLTDHLLKSIAQELNLNSKYEVLKYIDAISNNKKLNAATEPVIIKEKMGIFN